MSTQYRLSDWRTCPRLSQVRFCHSTTWHALTTFFFPDIPDPRLPSLRATSQSFPAEPFVIDREGEMPDTAVRTQSAEASRQQTPVPQESKTSALHRISSFPAYETLGDVVRTSTPDPIKVTSKKKKGTGKKKRTQNSITEITSSR